MAEEKIGGTSGTALTLPEPEIVPESKPQRVYPEEALAPVVSIICTSLLCF
jgi:hypothetical protein